MSCDRVIDGEARWEAEPHTPPSGACSHHLQTIQTVCQVVGHTLLQQEECPTKICIKKKSPPPQRCDLLGSNKM